MPVDSIVCPHESLDLPNASNLYSHGVELPDFLGSHWMQALVDSAVAPLPLEQRDMVTPTDCFPHQPVCKCP